MPSWRGRRTNLPVALLPTPLPPHTLPLVLPFHFGLGFSATLPNAWHLKACLCRNKAEMEQEDGEE